MNSNRTNMQEEMNRLRTIVQDESRPRPKAMARLAYLLCDSSLTKNRVLLEKNCNVHGKDELECTWKREAYEFAKKAIFLDPNQPLGYIALSVASEDFDERIKALNCTVRLLRETLAKFHPPTTDNGSSSQEKGPTDPFLCTVTLANILTRLLVEPRDFQGKRIIDVPRASIRHPCRIDLNDQEKQLYETVRTTLISAFHTCVQYEHDTTHGSESVTNNREILTQQKGALAKIHYRLGMFFRKMLPEDAHRSSSRWHFEQVRAILPENTFATKATFWLATFANDDIYASDDHSDSNTFSRIDIHKCPEEYVVSLYSTFASNFDDLLVNKLSYRTPSLLRSLVDQVNHSPMGSTQSRRWAKKGLDCGCGTGLSGLAFRDCVEYLMGIDLSSEMIEKAKQKQCYDTLQIGDIETICTDLVGKKDSCFDLVIACDVFVYIGELGTIFRSIRNILTPELGLFAFSTESLEESAAGNRPYILQSCARFAHKQSYIETLAKEVGLQVRWMQKSVIRKNQGEDVLGNLVLLSN